MEKRYVSIAPGLAVSSDFSVSRRLSEDGVTLSLRWSWNDRLRRVVLRQCNIDDPLGVRIRDISRLPIDQMVKSYEPELFSYAAGEAGTELFGPLPRWNEVLQSVDFQELRSSGPSKQTLTWVARMHAVSLLFGLRPRNKLICDSFGIPARTASHWLTLARLRVEAWESKLLPDPVTVHAEQDQEQAMETATKLLLI